MLLAKLFPHIVESAMVHINTINNALTALTTKVNIPSLKLDDTVAYTVVAADIGGSIVMDNAAANVVSIPSGLMSPGQKLSVIQVGVGATSIDGGTLNGAATAVAVGAQWSRKVVTCIATDTYTVN